MSCLINKLTNLKFTTSVMQIVSKINSRSPGDLDEFQSNGLWTSSAQDRQLLSFPQPMKTHVIFDSGIFNTSQPQPLYARPGNYGDDAARWLMSALQKQDVKVAAGLGQDFEGWYFCFTLEEVNYEFTLKLSDSGWHGTLERSAGLVSSIFGGRGRGISKAAVAVIDEALKSNDGIWNVKWVD